MKRTYHVLITEPIRGFKEELLAVAPDWEFRFFDHQQGQRPTKEDAQWADIIMGQTNPKWMPDCPRLKWMQSASAGVEHYLKPNTMSESVLLTNASGAYGLAIAEHMLGMLLSIQKKLALYRDAQNRHEWKSLGTVTSIYGSTVLILGMGDIGGEFAKRCKALGAYVIGMRRTNGQKPDYADELCLTQELDSVLPRADVLAIALPGTQETTGMISRARIDTMKEGSILLNVGRGRIVDTEAMCDALENGKLRGAGLDVVDPEPLPPEHRLWRIPSAVITPHVSGFYNLAETHTRIMKIFVENLGRFYRGEPLINQVDRAAGYRK